MHRQHITQQQAILVKHVANPTPSAPSQIRVSTGTAIAIGLLEGKLDAEPTTAYLMTHHAGKCTANCGFCPQARGSQSNAEMLSRVTWPAFNTSRVITHIATAVQAGKIRRVCIQALNYPQVFLDLCGFIQALKQQVSVPVSVSCQPLNPENIWSLSRAGADRIGIALDAATENLFNQVKGVAAGGPYTWQNELLLLRTAIGVFGEGNVSTHLMVGLGENEKEAAALIQKSVDMGVLPGLFAFTPVRGTALALQSQPKLEAYRRVQLARFLLVYGLARVENMRFDGDGVIVDFGVAKPELMQAVESGEPFRTSGCPDCNRPFYNEKPSGPLYNFPRKLHPEEAAEIKRQLKLTE